jgi:hypothetical protein
VVSELFLVLRRFSKAGYIRFHSHNAGISARTGPLGIPEALVNANTEKLAAYTADYHAAAASNAGKLDREDLSKNIRKIKEPTSTPAIQSIKNPC